MAYIEKTQLSSISNYYSKTNRKVNSSYYIVWHYTANDGDTDEANAKYFATGSRGASAHFFVDDDSITMTVPVNKVAWAVGGKRLNTAGGKLYAKVTNSNSISIELCDTQKNGKYDVSDKTLENAILKTRELMKTYGIPLDHVIRHYDVTGKLCPRWAVDENKWAEIKKMIAGSASPVPQPTPVTPSVPKVETAALACPKSSTIRDIQKWLNDRYNTGLKVDNAYGPLTKKALVKAVQTEIGTEADGIFGPKSKAASKTIRRGNKGILVTLWQCFLVCNYYNPNGIDSKFGPGCERATKTFQKDYELNETGVVDKETWYTALR